MTLLAETKKNRTKGEVSLTPFADAVLYLAGHEVTDPVLRGLLNAVASGEMSADEARLAARRHIQGDEF